MNSVVLLDNTFVRALVEETDRQHQWARILYRQLVDDFEQRSRRLVAADVVLKGVEPTQRARLFAPVRAVYVSASHRRAATAIVRQAVDATISPELALTLVLLGHEKISVVASFEPELRHFAVAILGMDPPSDAVVTAD